MWLTALVSPSVSVQIGCRGALPLLQAIVRTQFELPAYQWSLGVNGAAHAVPIERHTPAVIQTAHDLPTPVILIDEAFGNPGIGEQ